MVQKMSRYQRCSLFIRFIMCSILISYLSKHTFTFIALNAKKCHLSLKLLNYKNLPMEKIRLFIDKFISKNNRLHIVLTLFYCILLFFRKSIGVNRQVFIPGDILLGGLFPIHSGTLIGSQNASASVCGRIKADQGVQRMVAMLFGSFIQFYGFAGK